jgi:hypothetical protein
MGNIAKQSAVLITSLNYQVGARHVLQCVGQIKNGSSAQALVPNPQFSTPWTTQWHNASLIKFANFQNAIFRRELDQ